jgi:hypothetical protein
MDSSEPKNNLVAFSLNGLGGLLPLEGATMVDRCDGSLLVVGRLDVGRVWTNVECWFYQVSYDCISLLFRVRICTK